MEKDLPPAPFLMSLKNYRAFQDSGEFRLAPLTLLVGANSSGKSSIMSALLVLKQSIEQELVGSRVGPLILSGPYCDLGQYKDVVYGHRGGRAIGLMIGIPMQELAALSKIGAPLIDLAIPRVRWMMPRYRYCDEDASRLPRSGVIRMKLEFQTDEPFGPSLSRIAVVVDGVGQVNHVRTTGGERRQHWRTYSDGVPAQSVSVRFRRYGFFPRFLSRDVVYKIQPPRTKQRINRFITAANVVTEYLQGVLAVSEVMGPFRTPPERKYSFSGFTTTKAGPSGANAPDLLITERLLKSHGKPLQHAVCHWLKHLNLADYVSIEDIARNVNLFQMVILGRGKQMKENVADVGYGVSQVLPVIVQGLLIPRGGIYMVQQPELHLHPDAQAALADYFIHLVEAGVRVIVETHSEYLLLRLRRRLAEVESRRRSKSKMHRHRISRDAVSILLIESDAGRTGVSELKIGNGFQFKNLPVDFMSQSLDDRVILLKTVARHG
jgi:predicted ATPase